MYKTTLYIYLSKKDPFLLLTYKDLNLLFGYTALIIIFIFNTEKLINKIIITNIINNKEKNKYKTSILIISFFFFPLFISACKIFFFKYNDSVGTRNNNLHFIIAICQSVFIRNVLHISYYSTSASFTHFCASEKYTRDFLFLIFSFCIQQIGCQQVDR